MPHSVLGAKFASPRSTHDLAQQKRQNRRTTLPDTPDCTPAPPRHPQRSVHRDHGHLSHTGPLPDIQGSGPRPGSFGGNPRRADGDAVYFLNTINDAAALLLARGADFLSAFDKPQRDALVMVFLRMHGQGILANEVFWGLWLFPFDLLVYKSRFLPRILGVWLMLNCFAYLATSVTGILWPQYEQRVSNWVFPVMFGELAIMLWLIFMGARRPPPDPGD
jgi:hypothetical protein